MVKVVVDGYICEIRSYDPPKTTRYYDCLRILQFKAVPQKPIEDAIRFILNCALMPEEERKAIVEFQAYPEDRILVIRSRSNLKTLFEARIDVATNIGWYPYITGVDLPRSEISDFVNQITVSRRASLVSALKTGLGKPITRNLQLIPVSLRPNYYSFQLELNGIRILVDAGIGFEELDSINPRELDLVLVSHSHFDHTSALLALYHLGCSAPILATSTTFDFLLTILGVEKARPILNHIVPLRYDERLGIGKNCSVTFINAGHIPGAAMFLFTTPEHRILYTGDFCLRDHFPIKGSADTLNMLGHVDTVIADCSFADMTFEPDIDYYAALANECYSTLSAGKNVLISTDEAISQNLFLSLHEFFAKYHDRPFKPPVYIEERALSYMQIVRSRLEDLPRDFQHRIQRGRDPYASVMRRTISTKSDRRKALSEPSIILSGPDYDLSTYPICSFLSAIGSDEKNLLVLTGSGGRRIAERLIAERKIHTRDGSVEVKSKIFERILAFHCDYRQLELMLAKLQPEKLIPFHGWAPSITKILTLSSRYKVQVIIPRENVKIPF